MAKTQFVQTNFTSGVLSPLLKGRTDLQQYQQGVETGQNWVLLPQGGIRRRPGTEFIDKALPVLTRNTTVATMPEGGTAANISDEDDTTSTVTTTNISTLDPYVVAKLDLGTATFIEVVDVRGIFLTTNTSTEFEVQWSDNDSSYFAAAVVPLIGTTAQDFRLKSGQTDPHRYWRLVKIGGTDLGTDKVTLTDFNLWELSSTLSNVKLKDFSISSDTHYLMVFTDKNCRIYKKGGTTDRVADIKVPFLSSQVGNIRDVQSESVALFFHEDVQPIRIINLQTDTDWSTDDIPFTNIPQFDYNDASSPTPVSDVQVMTFTTGSIAWHRGMQFQLDIDGVLSKEISYAGDTTFDEQSSTAENIRKNIQDMPVTGETGVAVARTGANQYTITISGESAKAFELFSGFTTSNGHEDETIVFTQTTKGTPRKEDVWSDTRGYPKSACFYEGRLVLGGTKSKPQSVLLSKAGSALNFDIDEGDDDDAIFTTISSRKLNNIVDVFPGRNLQIFTDGSEFTVNVSPVTPSTFNITPQTSHGSLNIEAKEIDGATIFADRNGKSLKEYLFSFQEDAYVTADASVLSPELIKTPVDIAILGGTAADDANWVFIVNTDGSATVLNTLRAQDINGFTEWTTTGSINDASVVDDELYMINKRTVGAVESNFIERWAFEQYLDNSITNTNVIPLDRISGYLHLANETVRVLAIDPNDPLGVIVLPDRVVDSLGQIFLTTEEEIYTRIQAGIGFVPTLKPMPVNTNIGSGQNAMRLKKIIRMNLRIKDSVGIAVDGIPLPSRMFDVAASSPLGTFPNLTTGVIGDILSIVGWQRDEMPTFTVPDPTPTTILNIEYQVESS